MRARNIKPAFFQNEYLAEMTFEQRLFFIGLWVLADREGRLENRPKRIKMSLFPADDMNIPDALQVLQKDGFISLYSHDGFNVIQIENFIKHQTPHGLEKDSTLPDKNGFYTVWERSKTKCATKIFKIVTKAGVLVHGQGEFESLKNVEVGFETDNNSFINVISDNSRHTIDLSKTDDSHLFQEDTEKQFENVLKPDRNALNPDCGMWNPDILIVEDSTQENVKTETHESDGFIWNVTKLNDMLKASGQSQVGVERLKTVLVEFNPHYEDHDLRENQRLAKMVAWLKRERPVNTKQPAPRSDVNTAWQDQPRDDAPLSAVELAEIEDMKSKVKF